MYLNYYFYSIYTGFRDWDYYKYTKAMMSGGFFLFL